MDDGEVGAVLCALAGPRRGDRVAAVGAPALAVRALLAASGSDGTWEDGAGIAVTGSDPADAREAARRLAPGGRLVGLATDPWHAAVLVTDLGLSLRHVSPVAGRVAWSAVAPEPP